MEQIKDMLMIIFLPKSSGTFSGNINMNNNAIINPTSPSSTVKKKKVDDKTSNIISYKDLHFKSVARTTVWGQVSTFGNYKFKF